MSNVTYNLLQDSRFPPLLRGRFSKWLVHTPKTQFQQYGPFNMLFTNIFPAEKFIVKPQALIRMPFQLPEGLSPTHARQILLDEWDDIPTVSVLSENNMSVIGHVKDKASIDSQDGLVTARALSAPADESESKKGWKKFPDFVITTYAQSIDSSSNSTNVKDVVLLIVEVGSVGRQPTNSSINSQRNAVRMQLQRYMKDLKSRQEYRRKPFYGLAIVGNHFAFSKSTVESLNQHIMVWKSIYDGHFVPELFRLSESSSINIPN